MDLQGLSILAVCNTNLRGCDKNESQLFKLLTALLTDYLVNTEIHNVLEIQIVLFLESLKLLNISNQNLFLLFLALS